MTGTKSNKNGSGSSFWVRKFVEYCKRTDLHGYKYVVMKDLNVFERCFWAMAVLTSIGLSVYLVITAYKWFARNPIVTVIESTQGPIWDIPFPAVTICSMNIVSYRAARLLSHNLTLPEDMTADEVFESLRLVPLLHSTFLIPPEQRKSLHRLQAVMDMNHITVDGLYKKLSPARSCNLLLERCIWKNTLFRCDTLFESLFTHFGLCCAFNYFGHEAVNNFKGKKMSTSPRRVASCGYQTALSVLVNTDPGDYYSSALASKGALVMIDNTFNIPNVDSPIRMVNPSTEVLIALSPERTYTTPGVRKFKPEERQCYYGDEFKIGDFRQYSFHNCIAYRRMQTIRNVCECIPFFFPLNDYHRVCNFYDIDCLATILKGSSTVESVAVNKSITCLPECEHYDYPVEEAFGKLAVGIKLDGLPLFDEIHLENHTVVNVFFNDLVSTKYRRDVYLNWQNLLASFGGLLSLMLGFTLIAGFDLIIFFTFGVACDTTENVRRLKQSSVKPYDYESNLKEWKGSYISRDRMEMERKLQPMVIGWNEPFEDYWTSKKEARNTKKRTRY